MYILNHENFFCTWIILNYLYDEKIFNNEIDKNKLTQTWQQLLYSFYTSDI